MRRAPSLRQLVRSLRRAPLFTGGAILTLALGIGAAAAMFSVLDAVLLRALPYREPARLVVLRHTLNGLGIPDAAQSLGTYFFYRHTAHSLVSIAAWRPAAANLSSVDGRGDAERVDGASVTTNLLSTLGVAPVRGRDFSAADVRDSAHVALIAHDLWQRRFGGDPEVVGRAVRIDGARYTIVGVLPAEFHYPYATTELWRPLELDSVTPHAGGFNLGAVARLAPGATPSSAQVELNRLLPRLPSAYPDVYPEYPMDRFLTQSAMAAVVRPMREALVGGYSRALWIVAATVGLLLLAACANVATLLLVRAHGRAHELAVRSALGSSPRRLAGRWFGEAAFLAGIGGVLGIGVAIAVTRLLVRHGPSDFPRLASVHVDPATIVFTVFVACGIAVACGALPALRFASAPLAALLGAGGRTGSVGRVQQRAHRTLTVLQIALAVAMLGGAGLLARTVSRIGDVPPGFDATGTLAFTMSLPPGQFRSNGDVARLYIDALARVRTLPGVTEAGVTSKLPLVGGETLSGVYVDGFPVKASAVPPVFPVPVASAGYFRAMHIPLVAGRLFTDPADAEGSGDIIVSRAFALHYWATPAEALGRRVRMEQTGAWHTIVGVVQSVRDTSLTASGIGELYLPLRLSAPDLPDSLAPLTPRVMTVVLRTNGDPGALANGVRRTVHALAPGVPVYDVQPLTAVVSRTTARTRFVLLALVTAAVITMVLAMVGLYGVIAYAVTFRRREMGVRLALGAQPGSLLALVLGEGLALAGVGLVLGLAGYAAAARVLTGMLYGVGPADPATLAAVVAILLAVAAAASGVPAWHASRTDPAEALRAE